MIISKFFDMFSDKGIWFWNMSQFIVFLVSVFFILRQLKTQNNAHLVNSLTTLENRWKSQIMLKARKITCDNYSKNVKIVNLSASQILYFFEELGMYSRRKAIDIDVIWEIYSYDIEHYWPITKNGIINLRKEFSDETYFTNFESLYNDIKKINKKKGASTSEKTDDEIQKFIAGEKENLLFIDTLTKSDNNGYHDTENVISEQRVERKKINRN